MDIPMIVATINAGALILAIYQFLKQREDIRKQGQETRELARLTSDLDHRVHRLSVRLEKRIYRLERVRDLINGLVRDSVVLRQMNSSPEAKLGAAVARGMAFPELNALVDVIADSALTEIFDLYMPVVNHDIWPQTWNRPYPDTREAFMPVADAIDKLILEQTALTRQIHERVLKLMEEASMTE